MKCTKGYKVNIMRSAAGYYIGTSDEDGFPMCRISGYYKTKELAEKALSSKTFSRIAEEISFCNKGYGCFPEEMEENELKEFFAVSAADIIAEAKETMARCWNAYDEAMKRGEDAEIDDSYFEAEMLLKEFGIETY